jgi:hypothetical protein
MAVLFQKNIGRLNEFILLNWMIQRGDGASQNRPPHSTEDIKLPNEERITGSVRLVR